MTCLISIQITKTRPSDAAGSRGLLCPGRSKLDEIAFLGSTRNRQQRSRGCWRYLEVMVRISHVAAICIYVMLRFGYHVFLEINLGHGCARLPSKFGNKMRLLDSGCHSPRLPLSIRTYTRSFIKAIGKHLFYIYM